MSKVSATIAGKSEKLPMVLWPRTLSETRNAALPSVAVTRRPTAGRRSQASVSSIFRHPHSSARSAPSASSKRKGADTSIGTA